MRPRGTLLILGAALLAAAAGLLLSLRINGPGPLGPLLMHSRLGTWLLESVIAPMPPSGSHRGNIGERVANVEISDLQGHMHKIGEWHGRYVLVNAWASWCEPCRTEMPILSAFAARQAASGPVVIGLAQDNLPAIHGYLQRTPVNYRIFIDDPRGLAGIRLGNSLGALPYTVLIDGEGKLLRRKLGPFASLADLQAWANAPK